MTRRVDRWTRRTTIGCVGMLALIAGTMSYLHMQAAIRLLFSPSATWKATDCSVAVKPPAHGVGRCCRNDAFPAPAHSGPGAGLTTLAMPSTTVTCAARWAGWAAAVRPRKVSYEPAPAGQRPLLSHTSAVPHGSPPLSPVGSMRAMSVIGTGQGADRDVLARSAAPGTDWARASLIIQNAVLRTAAARLATSSTQNSQTGQR
jgi:hypothetical protein